MLLNAETGAHSARVSLDGPLTLFPRAFVRHPSGLRLDLISPDPNGWTDEDLAIGLSRTYRWGGHSKWPLPLSVAQHSLTVVELFKARAIRRGLPPPTGGQLLRELLHDADEALIGGFDAIAPLKPLLGEGYARIVAGLQGAITQRYRLEPYTAAEAECHKHADSLAAASEAVHVAGWKPEEVVTLLNIGLPALSRDPLGGLFPEQAWEPWAPEVSADRFLRQLQCFRAMGG
jgi:hypothetical protein